MIFSPKMAQAVLDNRKTVTRRLTHGKPCPYQVGEEYAVRDEDWGEQLGRIRIWSVTIEPYGPEMLDVNEAREEGFPSPPRDKGDSVEVLFEPFWQYWDTLHGEGHRDEPVYRIEFERVAE